MSIKNTALRFVEGTSDKVYQVQIEEVSHSPEYVVNFQYGRTGSLLKEGTKTPDPVSFEEAMWTYNKLVAEKMKKGYQEE